MEKYKPPYKITSKMVNEISRISEELVKLEFNEKKYLTPLLRKKNRVKTIAGTLEIEGNFLGEEKITAILDGKKVLGTMQEINEVEGAINAYKELNKYKYDSLDDLLKSHKILMINLLNTPGQFRNVNVGVGKHIAPPANRVNELMADLFDWLKNTDEHPLIKSSVFHYEFEFIHPFSDGNGRIGRLWQTVILYNWKKIFSAMPIESIVRDSQQEYYNAIEQSTRIGESTPFIEFMINMISNSIIRAKKEQTKKEVVNDTLNVPLNIPLNVPLNVPLNAPSDREFKILKFIINNNKITSKDIAKKLKVTDKTIKRDIAKLKKDNKLIRIGSLKNGYWKVNKISKQGGK